LESDEAEQRALKIIAKLDQALKNNKPNG
jgi:hypothetical protein